MKTLKNLIIILFLFLLLSSCDEGNEVMYENNAKLIWTGEYDVDGCGFFIEIDSVEYKPENENIIPPVFKVNEPLSITLQYIDLLYDIEYFCGDLPGGQKSKAIKLTSINLNGELPEN